MSKIFPDNCFVIHSIPPQPGAQTGWERKLWVYDVNAQHILRVMNLSDIGPRLEDATVYVPGARDNYNYLPELRDYTSEIKLGSPQPLYRYLTKELNARAFQNILLKNNIATSLGGWRLVTDHDITIAQLIQNINAHNNPSKHVNRIIELTLQHPVTRYAQFVPTLDIYAFGLWLSHVLDPRWYIHTLHPERTGKLERYLGLWLGMQSYVIFDDVPEIVQTIPAERCRLTRRCWLPSTEEAIKEIDCNDPRHFLFRAFTANLPKGSIKALLRSSQMFVRYLRDCWLNTLAVGTPHENALFDADHFFKHTHEADAYKQYVKLTV